MTELSPRGVHLVVVSLTERAYLLRRWASAVRGFTAVDLDCSLLPIFPQQEREGLHLLLEGGDIFSAVADVYSLPKGREPIVLNSLGTLQAEARATGGERDWSRLFFKNLVYMAAACRARADSSLFILNAAGEGTAKGALGAGWTKLCSLTLDGTWILSDDGLMPLS